MHTSLYDDIMMRVARAPARTRTCRHAMPHEPSHPRGTQMSAQSLHATHTDHAHQHGEGCGHVAVPHDDHVDYAHDGHRHAGHEGHWDEH
jgi:hypothetical protein